MWIHLNKYGINELIDMDLVRGVGFILFSDSNFSGVRIMYRDGGSYLIDSDDLRKNRDKCHEVVRDIAEAIKAITITKETKEKGTKPKLGAFDLPANTLNIPPA